MKKILVPFDGSGYSQKAFEKGLEIAEKFESKLIVMTVLQSKISDSAGISLERLEEIQEEEEDAATAMLKKLEDQANEKNIPFSIKIIHNPSSSDGIVSFADNNNIDLIVIGSHGRTGFRKIVLGSVASGVLEHAKCPVLITKGTE
ncbi:universal stress protein [Nitrosopumilus cobalaminigenes]|uniref:Universal stress protein n=1 Tax=Nitrosopumilus cobalaminigenes TaxID=1470066 RepID=A0A7D5M0N2_9ARCH|nr:universal stress protein [Nitrosopumilus cobalaminigenes]QLH03612.1 universal stress protein [Nitrosopumilus cobalaminigenes]